MMTKRVYIETMGCQMNVADTERTESKLRSAGFEIASGTAEADIVLLNSCSVRERAAQKVFNRIGQVRKQRRNNPPIFGVMGCVAQLEGETLLTNGSPVAFVAGTGATDRIPQLISDVLKTGKSKTDLSDRQIGEKWSVSPAERRSPYVAFVPIIEGCNKFCTYCIVPFSRGREKSRLPEEILNEVLQLRDFGYREIHLIGQNVNSYRPASEAGIEGVKGATPFSRLLRAVALTGIQRIKFTTSFPRDFHEDIVSAINDFANLCNWVHLPVQAGSNRVLKAMRRGYTVENYQQRIGKIRSSPRGIAITTDIIVGFPGETEQEFEETLKLVETVGYDSLYAFKYSVRQGTPAAGLGNELSEGQKADRLTRLLDLQKSVQKPILEAYKGRILEVLVEGSSAKSKEDMMGHTPCNKVVNFPGPGLKGGEIVRVLITEAKENSLYGRVA
jgi:tRNA-2-methylthio-N6-dimethylallyladenosine synthase